MGFPIKQILVNGSCYVIGPQRVLSMVSRYQSKQISLFLAGSVFLTRRSRGVVERLRDQSLHVYHLCNCRLLLKESITYTHLKRMAGILVLHERPRRILRLGIAARC